MWRSWLRLRATIRKFSGLIPHGVGETIHRLTISCFAMDLVSPQTLMKMSTRKISVEVKRVGA